jgi:hypothetical protein
VRSFAGAAFAALLFGSQVALVMLLTGPSFVLLLLLPAVVAAAVALQTFADPIQAVLDRVAFSRAAPPITRCAAGERLAGAHDRRLVGHCGCRAAGGGFRGAKVHRATATVACAARACGVRGGEAAPEYLFLLRRGEAAPQQKPKISAFEL